jgi:hypothetical protein
MRNRITHLLGDWNPESQPGDQATSDRVAPAPGAYPLPRGINMLMPVELCISRDLLITLLSASIHEMHEHKRDGGAALSASAMAELEAALQQQLAFRAWAREHPSSYICIAMYPTSDVDTVEDLEDLGEF